MVCHGKIEPPGTSRSDGPFESPERLLRRFRFLLLNVGQRLLQLLLKQSGL
jgi:hypothetical protein